METKLSGNASKFWHLKTIVRLKENIEEKKDFQVLQFAANHKLVEYRFDKQQLLKRLGNLGVKLCISCWEGV